MDAQEQNRVRQRLNPHRYLDILDEIDELLSEGWSSLGKNQIDALKLRAEVQFRRLQKVIPDLKAVEMSVEPDSPVQFIFQKGDTTVKGTRIK